MGNPKIRGQRRKLKKLLENIEDIQPKFDFKGRYEHFHTPRGWWISEGKTYGGIKTAFCKKWLEKTAEIIKSKPENGRFCRVTASVTAPGFWNSQITIFYDEDYYNTFFHRKGPYQTWTAIENKSFAKERGIDTPLAERGYIEILSDEEGVYRSEIWFYGEI